MHELGDLLSEEEIVSFMAVMDVNNDGVIGVRHCLGTQPCCAMPLVALLSADCIA
jgi:hypothetical protein